MMSATLSPLALPASHNYVAAFLTLACNLRCSYCINLHEEPSLGRRRILTRLLDAEQWIRALDRIPTRADRPITLQGGEPTVHKGFYDVVAGVRSGTKFDLLTNMQFDSEEFVRRVPLDRFQREAPYAPIRVSYHPGQNHLPELVQKAQHLQEHGFRVGIYGVLHPQHRDEILRHQEAALRQGIDFRVKEFLGIESGEVFGTYRYPEAITRQASRHCLCRTTELLISPAGYVYRCHSDLYEARPPVGHLLDPDFQVREAFLPCLEFGHCNPCDVKVKTDRHQQFGHTSVEIVDIRDLTPEEEAQRAAGDNGVRWILGDLSGASYLVKR